MKYRMFLFVLLAVFSLTGAEFCHNFSFEEPDAAVTDSGPAKLKGLYHPSADRDNDTPETTDPNRYHKPGVAGNALFFTAEYQSYGVIDNSRMTEDIDTLYLKVYVKSQSSKMQVIVGNKVDSQKSGYTLMRRANKWIFQYGDGQKSYRAEATIKAKTSDWICLEVSFNRGQVRILENGQEILNSDFPGKVIAASPNDLILGNYPSRNKKVYAFEGGLDELVIANSPETAAKYAAPVKMDVKTTLALCEPVDGYEKHFGGRKTLHSFADYPVPATFLLGFSDKTRSPVLAITVPEGVTIPEAFCSNHNAPSKKFKFSTRKVERDGNAFIEYRTLPGELRKSLKGKLGRGENVTLLFHTPKDFKNGEIRWAVYDGDDLQHQDSFQLELIEPPKPLPPGKFYYMCYTNQDIAFYSPEVFEKVASLFALTGITGKGRYYKSDARRAPLDEILHDKFGFTLFEISLWYGPLRSRKGYEDLIGPSVGPDGKPRNMNCPLQMSTNPQACEKYRQDVARKLITKNTKAAILDFEPWGQPGKGCFCDVCLAEFKKNFKINDEPLTARKIMDKYRKEWTLHWVNLSYRYMQMMAEAVRAMSPELEVWDYTYVFPYDDPEALIRRLWSIPKDPRRNEDFLECSMLSIYHLDGRKAFDQLELSRRNLKKGICSISLISRANANTGHYTAPEECLSPQQLYQKAVMTGALGQELFGIYPGHWIDGAVHVNLNRAARVVREHEKFYQDGTRNDSALKVNVNAPRDAYACTIHQNGDELLVTLFNFTGKPLDFDVEKIGKVRVAPNDVELRQVKR